MTKLYMFEGRCQQMTPSFTRPFFRSVIYTSYLKKNIKLHIQQVNTYSKMSLKCFWTFVDVIATNFTIVTDVKTMQFV